MTNINNDLGNIWNLRSDADALTAEAAQKKERADSELKEKLEELKELIQDYQEGKQVCPEIRQLMRTYPLLQEYHPDYWKLCAL